MKLILLLLIFTNLFSTSLKSSYTIFSNEFNASIIDNSIKNDFVIYTFKNNRHKKSFYTKDLSLIFEKNHHKLESSSIKLVHVKHVSNVDLKPIKEKIKAYYLHYYPQMRISDIKIDVSSFINTLPSEYTLEFKSNAFHYAHSSLLLKDTKHKKRYFMNYTLTAELRLLKARHNINRGKILTQIDVINSNVKFKRLKAQPFSFKQKTDIRVKKRLLAGKILYQKDFEDLPAVLKGQAVLVHLINGSVQLEFQAIALQDACIGDEIYVEKSNKKRFRVKVMGKNQVEIK